MHRFVFSQFLAATVMVVIANSPSLNAEELMDAQPSLLLMPLHTNQISSSESNQWEKRIIQGLREALKDRFEIYRPSQSAASWQTPQKSKKPHPDAVNLLVDAGAAYGIFGSISQVGDEQFYGYLVLLNATELEPMRYTTINVQGRADLLRRLDAEVNEIVTIFGQISVRANRSASISPLTSTRADRNEHIDIEFATTPAGASVFLNGSRVCEATPCAHSLRTGRHSLVFRLDDHDENEVEIDLLPESPVRSLHARLQPKLSTLRIETSPNDVHVSVIGYEHESKAWRRGVQIPSGNHQIEINDDCFVSGLIEVNVPPRIETFVELTARPEFAFIRILATDSRGNAADAMVYVNDEEVGRTGSILQVPACTEQAEIEFDGNRYGVRFAKIKAGTTTEITKIVGFHSVWQQASTGISWVQIPPGEFHFGCETNDPDCRGETVSEQKTAMSGFWMMETEAAVATYERCRQAGRCKHGSRDNPGLPVTEVSLQDAQDFCRWAGARIPSPMEWEYAAKSGQSNIYPWGNSMPDKKKANCRGCDDAFEGPSPVGSFPAGHTRWGLKDMAGNVWEWTRDSIHGTQAQARGGSWNFHPRSLRNAAFVSVPVGSRRDDLGIRCLRDDAAD